MGMSIVSQFSAFVRGLGHAFRRFPTEAALGVVYFILFILTETGALPGINEENRVWMILWFLPHYVLLFFLHIHSGKFPAARLIAVAVWFLWLPLVLHPSWGVLDFFRGGWQVGIAWVISAILLSFCHIAEDDESYGAGIVRTGLKVATGFILGGLMAAVMACLAASADYLFELHLNDHWFSFPIAFILMVIMPMLCCFLVTDNKLERAGGRFLAIAVDHILSPALIIYSVILYLYLARIIIRGQLPDGGVAYMVLGFLSMGLICHLMRLQVRNRHFEWFYKAFPIIAVAPLGLLWTGIARRIGEYGITEARFYLVVLAILVTIFTILLIIPRFRSFRLMAVILAAAAALFTYFPGIRARDFGIRSQQARLERVLPEVLENGKFPEDIVYAALEEDTLKRNRFIEAYGAWSYLEKEMTPAKFKDMYGKYGDFDFEEWRLDLNKWEAEETADEAKKIASWSLGENVDLGPYTELVPEFSWDIQEDRETVAFVRKASPADTLLYCPVKERLSSPFPTAKDVLIYSNETYLAVFNEITDFGDSNDVSFIHNGPVLLFKKAER